MQRLSKKDGNRMLRLVSGVSAEGAIDVKAHEKGVLEACLYPWGFVCRAPGGGCPENALMSDQEFAAHGHDKKTGAVVVLEPTPIKGKQPRVKEWNVVSESTQHGDPNMVSRIDVERRMQAEDARTSSGI